MQQHRQLTGDFDQLIFKGPGTLTVVQCNEPPSLLIEASETVLADIQSEVSAGVLHLGYRSRKVISLSFHREVINYQLRLRELRSLAVSGQGRVVIPDLDHDRFSLKLSGSGSITLEKLTADRLDVQLSGAGIIRMAGDVETQAISMSGAGVYSANDLVSDFADISVSGSGAAGVSVHDSLSVVISGSGTVSYGGYPEISKQISGSGKLVRRRRKSTEKRGQKHV